MEQNQTNDLPEVNESPVPGAQAINEADASATADEASGSVTLSPAPDKPKSKTSLFLEYLLMAVGSIVTAMGIYFFMFPNNFMLGGVSGLSIVLGDVLADVVPWLTPGTFVLVINMLLLAIGFLILGRNFGIRTAYCSVIVSVAIYLFERIFPMTGPMTTQPLLELVITIFLPAVGSALLFFLNASSGGTDVVAMILKKFFRINISPALFITDMIIVICGAFVFDTTTFLCSLVGLLAKVFLVNNVLESINTSKYCTVITTPACKDALCRFITDELHKGATVSDAYTGAYGKDAKVVILAALTRGQAVKLRHYTETLPEKTFIIITSTSEVLGLGFRAPI